MHYVNIIGRVSLTVNIIYNTVYLQEKTEKHLYETKRH